MNYPLFQALVTKSCGIIKINVYLKYIRSHNLYPSRRIHTKVPKEPTWKAVEPKDLPEETLVDANMVEHLERLALVDFNNEAGIHRLHAAIRFADQLHSVDTAGIEPMDSVLEDRELYLREDRVTEGGCRGDILSNAARTEEEYFVAPPGNIPLNQVDKPYADRAV